MSKDKNRSNDRMLALMKRATHGYGIGLHCVGGMPLKNRDIQRGLRLGFFKLERRITGWGFNNVPARRTCAMLTDKGREELAKHEPSNRFDEMAHRVAAIEASRVRAKSATPE
jgi:hypothetical protein